MLNLLSTLVPPLGSDLDTFEPTAFDAVIIFAPAVFLLFAIVLLFGPDPSTTYDREYEQAPPTDTPPALVPPLLRRSVRPESPEFTATLFDLIRRGYVQARPISGGTGGNGAMPAEGVDLELRRGDRTVRLADFERPVAQILDDAVASGPIRVAKLRAYLESEPENVVRFSRFSDGVRQAIDTRGWYTFTAARALLLTSLALFVLGMVGSWLLYTVSAKATLYFGAATIEGAMLLFHASWITKLVRRRRRTAKGQLEAKRWEAFRRYLTDFPRFADAPAGSLQLWESYLVYAIAFGLAHRVVDGAELYRLELLSGSPIFWLGLGETGRRARLGAYARVTSEFDRNEASAPGKTERSAVKAGRVLGVGGARHAEPDPVQPRR
jgi:uncharacterized membrane protein